MSKIRKANPEDAKGVYELLESGNMNSWDLNEQERGAILKNHWNSKEDYHGYVMEDEGIIVGFIGFLFSSRTINDKLERFCNLTSWYVKDEYRATSLELIFPVLGMRKYTLTNLTPTKDSHDLLVKFGFKDLEKGERLVFPVITHKIFSNKYRIITNVEEIGKRLTGYDAKIFNDHRQFNCTHLLIVSNSDESDYSYSIMRRMDTKKLKATKIPLQFGYIYYLNNKEVFADAMNTIRAKIFYKLKVLFISVEDRYIEDVNIKFSQHRERPIPTVYKSKTLDRTQVDGLYSEFFVLDPWSSN